MPRFAKVSLKKIFILLATPQPQFLLPAAAPALVGTSLGFLITGQLDWLLALLAFLALVGLNAGSNMLNDYFDHLSGNDWFVEQTTPFSGGSRYIQNGIITPAAMLIAGIAALAIGIILGLIIVVLTRSTVILTLGVIGVAGGIFWTAPPFRICYRFLGEPFIFILFGLLPVYGCYYLQTQKLDLYPLLPGCILGIFISMVLLINTFPDAHADAQVNKRTMVVRYGIHRSLMIFRIGIVAPYIIAIAGIVFMPWFRWSGLLMMLSLPAAVAALKFAKEKDFVSNPGYCKPNPLTILTHTSTALLMTIGFVIAKLNA